MKLTIPQTLLTLSLLLPLGSLASTIPRRDEPCAAGASANGNICGKSPSGEQLYCASGICTSRNHQCQSTSADTPGGALLAYYLNLYDGTTADDFYSPGWCEMLDEEVMQCRATCSWKWRDPEKGWGRGDGSARSPEGSCNGVKGWMYVLDGTECKGGWCNRGVCEKTKKSISVDEAMEEVRRLSEDTEYEAERKPETQTETGVVEDSTSGDDDWWFVRKNVTDVNIDEDFSDGAKKLLEDMGITQSDIDDLEKANRAIDSYKRIMAEGKKDKEGWAAKDVIGMVLGCFTLICLAFGAWKWWTKRKEQVMLERARMESGLAPDGSAVVTKDETKTLGGSENGAGSVDDLTKPVPAHTTEPGRYA